MTPAERLQKAIGYDFSDLTILSAALRHRSVGSGHNERLEFLGDSILGMVVAAALYERYGDAGEGDLTRLRVQLVRQRTLANVARRIDLGATLQLGVGAARSGGADRSSILSDGLEALIAAIFLDSDFSTVRSVIHFTLSTRASRDRKCSAGERSKNPAPGVTSGRGIYAPCLSRIPNPRPSSPEGIHC